MKVLILAGGLGTRLAEETHLVPKPMVQIGGRPILWHVMNIYASCGFTEFVVALGYKGDLIKQFFLDYHKLNCDLSVDLKSGDVICRNNRGTPWTIHLIDTGLHTMTGGRIRRLKDFIGNETFMVTYSDGLADINVQQLVEFHKSHGKLATLTAVPPPSRFGNLELKDSMITSFQEKPPEQEGLINGGFFVLEPEVFDYIDSDSTSFEVEPLGKLAEEGELMAYRHEGFWQMMDTILEKRKLEALWESGNAPWNKQ